MIEWIGHLTDGAEATGNGRLALQFTIALGKREGTKVAGHYEFDRNALRLPDIPPLTQVSGQLDFTRAVNAIARPDRRSVRRSGEALPLRAATGA